jgi:hypothetical protein
VEKIALRVEMPAKVDWAQPEIGKHGPVAVWEAETNVEKLIAKVPHNAKMSYHLSSPISTH